MILQLLRKPIGSRWVTVHRSLSLVGRTLATFTSVFVINSTCTSIVSENVLKSAFVIVKLGLPDLFLIQLIRVDIVCVVIIKDTGIVL